MNSLQLFFFPACGVFSDSPTSDALQRWELSCVTTASSSLHAAIPTVSWDCVDVSGFNSALLSQNHIPSQAPLIHSVCMYHSLFWQ